MKYLKTIISVMLIVTITLVSCKKDSTTGPTGGAIVGTWSVVDAVMGWLLTTNSNQVATNMFDVTGQINIGGAYTGTMDFMLITDDATNLPSFWVGNFSDENQNHFLILDGSTGEGTFFINTTNQTFFGNITYAYNGGTLTITQSTITDVASSATVTISGTLSFKQTTVPTNTPTRILFPDNFGGVDGIGLTAITFNSDGTGTVTDVYEGGTDTENWTYTTSGNQLTITDESGETMTFEYSITGNTMSWIANDFEDYCGDFDSQAECFTETESFFNLASGSLTAVSFQVEFIFNKSTAKLGLNVGKNYHLIDPTKVISDYKLKIDNIKRSL